MKGEEKYVNYRYCRYERYIAYTGFSSIYGRSLSKVCAQNLNIIVSIEQSTYS